MGQETSHVFAACPGKASSPLLPLVVLRFLSVELVFVPRDHYMAHGGVSPSGKRSHKCTPAAECSKHFLTLLIPMPPAARVVCHVLIVLLVVRCGRSRAPTPLGASRLSLPTPQHFSHIAGHKAQWVGSDGFGPLGRDWCPPQSLAAGAAPPLLPRVSSQASALLLGHRPFLSFTFKNKRSLGVQPFFFMRKASVFSFCPFHHVQ